MAEEAHIDRFPLPTDSPATLALYHRFRTIEEELMVTYDDLLKYSTVHNPLCPEWIRDSWYGPCCWAHKIRALIAKEKRLTKEMEDTNDAYIVAARADWARRIRASVARLKAREAMSDSLPAAASASSPP